MDDEKRLPMGQVVILLGVVCLLTSALIILRQPQAKFLVYAKGEPYQNQFSIYVLNLITGIETRLTNFGSDTNVTWSRNWRWIAYTSTSLLSRGHFDFDYFSIYVADLKEGKQFKLAERSVWPQWSPDGEKIVFLSFHGATPVAHIINRDGANQQTLTDAHDIFSSAGGNTHSWSPDGEEILFTSNRLGPQEIYLIGKNGQNLKQITNNRFEDRMVAWSPDGQEIVFTTNRDGNDEIYIMNTDGENLRRLTYNEVWDTYPTWSPDGRRIAFMSLRNDIWGLYSINMDGTNERELAKPISPLKPIWSPDANSIFAALPEKGLYEINVVTGLRRQLLNSNQQIESLDVWPK